MFTAIVVVAVIAAVITIYMLVDAAVTKKRLEKSIRESYGMVPEAPDEYDFESIAAYYAKTGGEGKTVVDDMTWKDLDMDRVFFRLNACQSSCGEEYLYKKLHSLRTGQDDFDVQEKFIARMEENPTFMMKLKMHLALLGHKRYTNIPFLISSAKSQTLKNTFAYRLLAVVPMLCIATIFLNVPLGILLLFGAGVMNGIVYYKTMRKIENPLKALNYFSSVLWCAKKMLREKNDIIKIAAPHLKEDYAIFERAIFKLSGRAKKRSADADILIIYLKFLFFIDIIPYNKAMKVILSHTTQLQRLYEAVGNIDAILAVMSIRKSMPLYSRPVFGKEKEISFDELVHPLLDSPVANMLEVDKSAIITGSNASGKSTFIKAVAINCILAQTVHTCFAKRFRMPHAQVMTSMAVKDDIIAGESYYIAEIKSIKRILDAINEEVTCICFIDEILRGTNTAERIAASYAVLGSICAKNALCFVASHDVKLADMLRGSFESYHFSERVEDGGITFDYKIKNGAATSQNAIKLLDVMGFDKRIVEAANRTVEELSAAPDANPI